LFDGEKEDMEEKSKIMNNPLEPLMRIE